MMTLLQIFGSVQKPDGLKKYKDVTSGGLVDLINIIFNTMVVIAGLYVLVQIILAGYGFISAHGDSKAVETAWAKIWQSLVGLMIVVGSFALAALVGWLFFGDASAILKPKIFTP